MSHINNLIDFSRSIIFYNMTSEDEVQGTILGDNTYKFISNLIVSCKEQKSNLNFDPNNPLEFAQQEAYLRGQIAGYMYLLECHKKSLEFRAANNQM